MGSDELQNRIGGAGFNFTPAQQSVALTCVPVTALFCGHEGTEGWERPVQSPWVSTAWERQGQGWKSGMWL